MVSTGGPWRDAVKLAVKPLEEHVADDVGEARRVHELGVEDQMAFHGVVELVADAGVKGVWQFQLLVREEPPPG